jgi:O-methyltransferase
MKKLVKTLLIKIFEMLGVRVWFGRAGNLPRLKYNTDKDFINIYKQIERYTLVNEQRAYILYQFIKQAKNHSGDVAEVGVYRGGTARLFASIVANSDKNLYLFDTFAGMPYVNKDLDLHNKGDFSDTSIEKVKEYVGSYKNVFYFKGLFPQTAGPISDKKFCFVHIDVDIYQSVKDCCEYFYNRLAKGGIIIFDDYGFPSCPGAKKALDEFFKDKPEFPCYLSTGQLFMIKL